MPDDRHLRLVHSATTTRSDLDAGADVPPLDNWRGKRIAEHVHTGSVPGADCPVCGFPWWPPEATS